MYAEAVWKQIEKKKLDAGGLVDAGKIRGLGADLTEEALGRLLFELAAAAQVRGMDPEGALRRETSRVVRGVEAVWDAAKPQRS
jgi:XTP/dITP diphosphohydrolase/tetrapyrrole methylase family protein/MazG family protein